MINLNQSDTLFEVGNGASDARSNAFDVTYSGYIRTGKGYEKIAFGKNGNGEYGYWIPATQSEPETFVPWITSPGPTYTAGTNIDITNNVISAPNVAPIVNGKVPEQYLPSYVDDVIEGYYNSTDGKFYEESTYQTEIAGERGKIYISLDTDKSYRWSGTVFVELTSGGVVYSAGSGIDISGTNEISVDNTIARMTDLSGYLPLTGGTMAGAINSQNIVPATDDSYRLGSSTSKYNSAYVKRIYNLASIESTTDGSKRLLVPAKSGTIAVNEDLPNVVENLISVTPILESGTLIANVTINGVSKNLYAPSGGSSYSAGDGIDISNNEISVDDTIARVSAIPDELANLTDDSTHRLVTDTEKSTWNGKQGALTAGTGIALSSANTISIKYYGAHAEAASGGANNNKREGMADSGDGMFLTGSYNDPNAPYAYGNIINLNGGGTGQLFLGWRGDSNTGTLYYRSHRDNASAAWGPWKQIAYTSDIPSIPSVGNGTLTIQKNGTNVQTFTANQSGNATANIIVPFDYNETSVDDDQEFKGAPHYGKFSGDSSVGELMDGDDGVYMFLPYGTNSLAYGFVLACNDDGNQFYLGSLDGEDDGTIDWSRIYHDGYHPLAGKADFIKFPRNAVDYNTAMRSRAKETVAFDELSGTTGKPSYISTFTNPWFNLITMHSADANYGSQLAIPMTGFTAPAWRYYAGGNFGSWEYIPSADALSVGDSSTPVYLENGKLKTISSGYLPLAGGTMSAGAKITFTNSATEDGIYLNNGSYQLRLIIGSGGVNRGLWDGSRWMIYEDATNVTLNSPGSLILNNNTVINHTDGNWISGLRINSVANNANGSAHITFGGQSGTTTGTTSSYPMYQVGKMSDISGGFAIRAEYNGTYHDVFKASPTTGLTELLSYANGTTVNITAKESDIDLTATPLTTSKITLKTNNVLFAGTNTTSGTIRTGTGDPSRPFKFTGYESGSIEVSTTAYPSVTLNDGDLILLFLSSGAGNSFYAARLLRNNNGSLQSSNLATTGTSHATVTMRSNKSIVIQNTSSSYKLNYKILRLG